MLLNRVNKKLADLSKNNLLRNRKIVSHNSTQNNIINIDGHNCIDFTNNDYLGLRFHKRISESITQGAKIYGNGAGASNMISGYNELQHSLEVDFASWLGVEKTILFNSGYLANLGVITALSDRKSTIILDKLCHSSILDAVILSRAKHYRYKHCSAAHLKELSKMHSPELMITENVFSMEGDIAPISNFLQIADNNKSLAIIDDAHGIGVLGKQGRGILDQEQINKEKITCVVIPLGKAFCGLGAIVAGKKSTLDIILQRSKTYRYTTALPPAIISGLKASLNIITRENWRREKLHQNIHFFNGVANEQGVALVSSHETPIRAILIENKVKLLRIQNLLLKRGFYVSAIRPPTVPEKSSRLRISLNALHSERDIVLLINNIRDLINE